MNVYLCPHCKTVTVRSLGNLIRNIRGKPDECTSCGKTYDSKDAIVKPFGDFAEESGLATAFRKYEPSFNLGELLFYILIFQEISKTERIEGVIRVLGRNGSDYDTLWVTDSSLLLRGDDQSSFFKKPYVERYQYASIVSLLFTKKTLERPSIKISFSSGEIKQFTVPRRLLGERFVDDITQKANKNPQQLPTSRVQEDSLHALQQIKTMLEMNLITNEEYDLIFAQGERVSI